MATKAPSKIGTKNSAKKLARKSVKKSAKGVAKKSLKATAASPAAPEVQPTPIATAAVPSKKPAKVVAKRAAKNKPAVKSALPMASVNPSLVEADQAIAKRESELQDMLAERQRLQAEDIARRLALVTAELPIIANEISDADRRRLLSLLAVKTRKVSKKAAKTGGAAKGKKMPAKYRLPTGETWTGRGRRPFAFLDYEKANPGKGYPLA